MNHPTKYVIQFICEQIVNTMNMQNTMNYEVDVLEHTRCILYKCVEKNVNFDLSKHTTLMYGITNVKDLTQFYYDKYKEIGFEVPPELQN